MRNRYDAAEAAQHVDRYAPRFGEPLALRTYTARLLGAEPALVLHGGGNTSAKGSARTLFGEPVEVLWIKGSGSDLATIEPQGHPAVRLEPLRRLRTLDVLTDEAMVNELRTQLLDAMAPSPSIECLLHAFLPHWFIDHTHADAVLALADQPDAERICRGVYGDGLVFVPYVKPGFALAKACIEAYEAVGERAELIVLQQHGIFTFGPDAPTSYSRMIDAVSKAERYVEQRGERRFDNDRGDRVSVRGEGDLGSDRRALRRKVFPILRGALSRVGGATILAWDARDEVRNFVDDERWWPTTQVGPATPDHVIRTKPWPMIAPRVTSDTPLDEIRRRVDAAVEGYVERYKRYVATGVAARGTRQALDPAPRVILVPGVGVVGAGKTTGDAAVAVEIYAHTLRVIQDASSIGEYRPVAPLDLFDLEYWPLEQAKLGKQTRALFDGKIALITGAASGIGRAISLAFLELGAHVVMSDRDHGALHSARELLARRFAARIAVAPCDVSELRAVEDAFAACIDAYGGVDIVVSNAGTAEQGFLHDGAGERALASSLQVNLWGHQYVARFATEIFLAQSTGGALLFNASKAAFNPGPSFGPYSVAKAATIALMRQYAIDLAPHGVRCNAVNADRVRTGLFSAEVIESRASARGLRADDYFVANLLGREVSVEDVAGAFVFLASAPSTTGCVVTVDGGNPAAFPR